MDAVRLFNNELSSLYESKPPVSRAKMAQITKCAIKAIKFYKHVVQSVEKFIQKCKPEYKVPGLYVIDSIVRQSKHQFGPEKDVFSPRFTKNIVSTFTNLFKCPVEERNRVIRVLNLWQKNAVFPLELIQPLVDLAADPDDPALISAAHRAANGIISTSQKVSLPLAQPSSNSTDSNSNPVLQQTEMLSTITKLLQQAKEGTITSTAPESQLQHLQSLQQQLAMQTERISKPQEQPTPPIDSGLLAQIQVLTSQLLNKTNSGGPDTVNDVKNTADIKEPLDVNRRDVPDVNRRDGFDVNRRDGFDVNRRDVPDVNRRDGFDVNRRDGFDVNRRDVPDVNRRDGFDANRRDGFDVNRRDVPDVNRRDVPDVNRRDVPDVQRRPQISVEPIFNKKLLEFDYGDSDEEEDRQDHHHQPEQQQPRQPSPLEIGLPTMRLDENVFQHIKQIAKQQEMLQSEIGAQDNLRRRLLEQQQQQFDMELEQDSLGHPLPPLPPPPPPKAAVQEQSIQIDDDEDGKDNHENQERVERADRRRHIETRERSRDRSKDRSQDRSKDRSRDRSKDRSRDKSRSPRRRSRRSRSRSRDKDRDRDRRRRSRSRDRHRRSRERERRERDRERERERRKLGLPSLKDKYISICTTTLWFGRLTKSTTENELREHIETYGKIRTINMIPPRGCAFVCLTKRKDASKALDRLKGVKINGNAIKVAWAPGTGIKESAFKDLWNVDSGVTYIPWDQLPTDVQPLLVGGMVDEESLPEKLKGMKTGEEEEEEAPPQMNPSSESGGGQPENNVPQPQPPPPLPMNMIQPPPGFPLPGQNRMNLMGPGGPLSLLSGPPPPIGMPPGMRAPLGLGGPGNLGPPTAVMVSHNNMMLPNMTTINTMGNPNSMVGVAGLRGPMPNMPMVGPGPMNMSHQIPMMGGQGNGIGIPGGAGHNIERVASPHVNSPGPRGPFGQFNNMHRFPHAQNPRGMPPPFVSNSSSGQPEMGDSDMRAMAETMEWPPDDEVNAEDETDDHPMDSDERLMHLGGQQRMPGPGMPNLPPGGHPFGLHRPMLPGQGPPNPMMAMPNAAGPRMPLIPVHMMPPPPQQPVITVPGGGAPAFALAHGGMRIPMPTVGVRQGLMPAVTSPHLLPPSTGAPPPVAVSVNGSVVVTRPGLPSIPVSIGGVDISAVNSEALPSEDDKVGPNAPGPRPVMQIHDNNHPPSGPVLGRCFAPMTIRPRAGPALLGMRPGAPGGGGGFNRFGGPRPLMRPAFGRMDRPPFANRFAVVFRPPVGFLDQDEREDRDERRPLPRLDVEEHQHPGADVPEQSLPKDIDERSSTERKDKNQDVDLRQDIDERSKLSRDSRRPSRWYNAGGDDETSKLAPADGKANNNASGGPATESISASEAPAALKSTTDALSATSQAPVTTHTESVQSIAEVSVARNDVAGVVDKITSGGVDAIQLPRSNDASEKTGS